MTAERGDEAEVALAIAYWLMTAVVIGAGGLAALVLLAVRRRPGRR